MGCVHIMKGQQCIGHICQGSGRRYLVYVREYGHRIYDLVGKPTKSRRVAIARLSQAMLDGDYKRGILAFVDDYYDPAPLYEIVRH